ncbi:host attachment protein [Dyella japonica]|uniref:Protein required for attachment to host cells n=1 Tax=Dyella japonica TaxID=231455 RepID=A0ABV2JP63_9GAMM
MMGLSALADAHAAAAVAAQAPFRTARSIDAGQVSPARAAYSLVERVSLRLREYIMSTAWILVSDAARARIFETIGGDASLVEVACYTNPALRGTPALTIAGRTVPRTQESVGSARHVIEPHTGYKDKETHGFAHMLVVRLLNAHAHHHYDRLFLVAPPHFLGVLHEHLRQPATVGFAEELAKDVVALPPADLLAYLKPRLSLRPGLEDARAG